jgi:hypothetical protein
MGPRLSRRAHSTHSPSELVRRNRAVGAAVEGVSVAVAVTYSCLFPEVASRRKEHRLARGVILRLAMRPWSGPLLVVFQPIGWRPPSLE